MHILYLDDSGSPQNPNEAYFVLGGISVPENSIRWLTHQISQLAEKLDPNTYPTLEFHASEIFGGRNGIWANFKDRQARIDIIKDVLLVPENANANSEIVTFACAIHKASFPNVDPVELAYEEITDRFNKYLERISQRNQPQR